MCQENLRLADSNEARDGGARMEARSLGALIPKRLSASQGRGRGVRTCDAIPFCWRRRPRSSATCSTAPQGPLDPLGFNSPNIAQRHALHVERTAGFRPSVSCFSIFTFRRLDLGIQALKAPTGARA